MIMVIGISAEAKSHFTQIAVFFANLILRKFNSGGGGFHAPIAPLPYAEMDEQVLPLCTNYCTIISRYYSVMFG